MKLLPRLMHLSLPLLRCYSVAFLQVTSEPSLSHLPIMVLVIMPKVFLS